MPKIKSIGFLDFFPFLHDFCTIFLQKSRLKPVRYAEMRKFSPEITTSSPERSI